MKVSIITVCLNSERTICETLNSLQSQDYKNIEHIIVDGGSTDRTIFYLKKYKSKRTKIFLKKNLSLYKSLNLGIRKSTGKIISILHSDDIYNSTNTISKIMNVIKKHDEKIFFGNVVYYKENFTNIVRYYSSKYFKTSNFLYGYMPPHTATFFKREVLINHKLYQDYKIAADFEHILRLVYKLKYKYKLIDLTVSRMKTGGLATKNIFSFFYITYEIYKAFKLNKLPFSLINTLSRGGLKILQYFLFNKEKLNKSFKIKYKQFYKKYSENKIKLFLNLRKINFKKNFILSALNLAFLGSYAKNQIVLSKELIHWPDGIFTKIYNMNIKKIPGRDLFKFLILKKNINRIVVLGELTNNGRQYLKKTFNLSILNKPLPYGNINLIKQKTNFKIKKKDLVLITLPTPKQEQIAQYLADQNKYFKIICIGGSIKIVCGDEKPVPLIFNNFEFIWRLRYETKRRIVRLLDTFYSVIKDRIFNKKIPSTEIRIINA